MAGKGKVARWPSDISIHTEKSSTSTIRSRTVNARAVAVQGVARVNADLRPIGKPAGEARARYVVEAVSASVAMGLAGTLFAMERRYDARHVSHEVHMLIRQTGVSVGLAMGEVRKGPRVIAKARRRSRATNVALASEAKCTIIGGIMNQHDKEQLLKREIERLGYGFHTALTHDFLSLVAALRLHGFAVQRADEPVEYVEPDNLWAELGNPAIWIYAESTVELVKKRKAMDIHDPDYLALDNQITADNLKEQMRLVNLLDEFYKQHKPTSFYSRLIVETMQEDAESNLTSQGSSIRVILDRAEQQKLIEEFHAEALAFSDFLMASL